MAFIPVDTTVRYEVHCTHEDGFTEVLDFGIAPMAELAMTMAETAHIESIQYFIRTAQPMSLN